MKISQTLNLALNDLNQLKPKKPYLGEIWIWLKMTYLGDLNKTPKAKKPDLGDLGIWLKVT